MVSWFLKLNESETHSLLRSFFDVHFAFLLFMVKAHDFDEICVFLTTNYLFIRCFENFEMAF